MGPTSWGPTPTTPASGCRTLSRGRPQSPPPTVFGLKTVSFCHSILLDEQFQLFQRSPSDARSSYELFTNLWTCLLAAHSRCRRMQRGEKQDTVSSGSTCRATGSSSCSSSITWRIRKSISHGVQISWSMLSRPFPDHLVKPAGNVAHGVG